MLPRKIATAITILVTLVWFANFILPTFVPSYHSDPTISGIFSTIVGAAFILTRPSSSERDKRKQLQDITDIADEQAHHHGHKHPAPPAVDQEDDPTENGRPTP